MKITGFEFWSQYLLIIFYLQLYFHIPQLHPKNINNRSNKYVDYYKRIDEISKLFPGRLTLKDLRTIKTRLFMKEKEVSVLVLLGRSRDSQCQQDPTFCVGKAIANITEVQFGYLDASKPLIKSEEIERKLKSHLDGSTIMVDSLESLPGNKAMNLFQFIDKEELQTRKGMLLLTLYAGTELLGNRSTTKHAYVVEKVLAEKWSPFIPRDTLTSVISRICGSIIKIK